MQPREAASKSNAPLNSSMSKDNLSEKFTDLRRFMNLVNSPFARSTPQAEFGKKQSSEFDADAVDPEMRADNRREEIVARANDEKKKYGFLQKLQQRAFGKKARPEAEPFVEPEQRSEEERLNAVVARARKQG